MRNRLLVTFAVLALVFGVVSPTLANPKGVPNENAIGYWTADRMANAIPRDFQFEPGAKVGKLISSVRGKSTGSVSSGNSGSSWIQGGNPANATGKVFFSVGVKDYVCSGSVVKDDQLNNRSIVLTAGHCVFDTATGQFVTKFIYVPNYDALPGKCSQTLYGCWAAVSLVAHSGFTSQTAFTTTATQHDWGFAVLNLGGKSNLESVEKLGTYELDISGLSKGAPAAAFGYPAAAPYSGADLVYCLNPVSEDAGSGNTTWGLSCNMTGGASGGPWLSGFDVNNAHTSGKLSSVNSYKYGNQKNMMYGPKFNDKTTATFNAALNTSNPTVVVGAP